MKLNNKFHIMTYDKVYGLVDYGEKEIDLNKSAPIYITKERCRKCGAAWIAEDYVNGHRQCPKCGTTSENDIMHIE